MPRPTATHESWTDEHTLILLRGLVTTTLSSRPTLYQLPGLEGVNSNGGNRINQKLQQILAGLLKSYPGTENVLKTAISQGPRRSPVKGKAKNTSSKASRESSPGHHPSPIPNLPRRNPSEDVDAVKAAKRRRVDVKLEESEESEGAL